MNFLNNIIEQKLLEISIQSVREPFDKLKNINRDLPILKFNEYFKTNNTGIISELKQKLLSNEKKSDRELILKLIKNLQKIGVSAFSVLTDKKYFNGSLSFLKFINKLFNSYYSKRFYYIWISNLSSLLKWSRWYCFNCRNSWFLSIERLLSIN